jgi:hypothetical protein
VVCGKPVRIRREPVAVTGDGRRTNPLAFEAGKDRRPADPGARRPALPIGSLFFAVEKRNPS